MVNPIVTVNVTQTIAPTPNALQKQGAFISQGGTTLAIGATALLTQASDLTSILAAALALTSLSWASTFGGTVTVATTAAHGVTVGQRFVTTIAGVVPAGYNGTYLATATGASAFTYKLVTNPGAASTPGTYTPRNVAELVSMAATFFAQGAVQGVSVLELGAGEPAAGVAALSTFITTNDEQSFYSYLVPRNWDGNSTFLTFLAGYEATTSKTYFFVTTTLQNYALYADIKCVLALIEAPQYGIWLANTLTAATWSGGLVTATTTSAHGVYPGQYFTIVGCTPDGYNGTFLALTGTTGSTLVYAVTTNPGAISVAGTLSPSVYASAGTPATEFSWAAGYYVALNYAPSTTNKVTPYSFSFLTGVTQFPTRGKSAVISALKAANVNYVGYGAEGGITNKILLWGRTMDGNPFNYWYSVDWMQINVDLAISNAIINGSNNPINPLYYNQNGIDRLEAVAADVGANAITFGLALGSVKQVGLNGTEFTDNLNRGLYAGNLVVNAVPFVPYLTASPSDYQIGKYAGLSMVYTPLRGFDSIIFNINVTQFAATAST